MNAKKSAPGKHKAGKPFPALPRNAVTFRNPQRVPASAIPQGWRLITNAEAASCIARCLGLKPRLRLRAWNQGESCFIDGEFFGGSTRLTYITPTKARR